MKRKVSVTTRITFNGREYTSADEMPPDVRRAYDELIAGLPDANRNGVPDVLEQPPAGGDTFTAIVVNGKTYDRVEEMPAEVRALYERALAGTLGQTPAQETRHELTWTTTTTGPTSSKTLVRVIGVLLLVALLVVLALR